MTDYARVRLNIEYSENSDYSRPAPDTQLSYTGTPTSCIDTRPSTATTGTYVRTAHLTTVTFCAITNLDATNYVTVTYRSAGNGGTDNKVRLQPGGMFATTDITAANDLYFAANTAAVKVHVIVLGT